MFHVPSSIQGIFILVEWNEHYYMPRLGNDSNVSAREHSSSQQEETSSRNMMLGIPRSAWCVERTNKLTMTLKIGLQWT